MKKRVFVAVELSDEARKKISGYLERLRSEFPKLRVGWERAEKLHLTLKFLGEIDEEQLKNLTEAIEKVAHQIEKFTLQITETGQFGKRVLWLGVKDESGHLLKTHESVENEIEKIGFIRESKSFKPHLTIARLREPFNSSQLVKKHLQNKFEPLGFEVAEIVIYESRLQPTGSIYKTLSRHRLLKL